MRAPIVVAAVGAALVLIGGTVAALVLSRDDDGGADGGEDDLAVQGTLTIVGGGGYTTHDPCYGISGGGYGPIDPFDYSDIYGGAPVRVLDAAGDIIGTGELRPGEYVTDNGVTGGDGCVFEFEVPLDKESQRYQFVIGQWPPYDFDDPDDLELVVGPS